MARNYAKRIPADETGIPLQDFPAPFVAQATTAASTNISSVFTFSNNSTTIEVGAPNVGVAIKWIGIGAAQTSVVANSPTAANFDHFIPASTVRRFVIPQETQGIAGPALANSVHGLYQRMAAIPVTAAVSSILVTEY